MVRRTESCTLAGSEVERPAGKLFPVGDEGRRHGVGGLAEHHRHGHLEEQPVGPKVDRPVGAVNHRWPGLARLELGEDHLGVAIDVGADLQHRNAPITAGQRDQLGLWHDHRLDNRSPGHALHAQHDPHLLRER